MTHDQRLMSALDAFQGSPEEFGELLHNATSPVILPGWDKRSKIQAAQSADLRTTARRIIYSLPCGIDILNYEAGRHV